VAEADRLRAGFRWENPESVRFPDRCRYCLSQAAAI